MRRPGGQKYVKPDGSTYVLWPNEPVPEGWALFQEDEAPEAVVEEVEEEVTEEVEA